MTFVRCVKTYAAMYQESMTAKFHFRGHWKPFVTCDALIELFEIFSNEEEHIGDQRVDGRVRRDSYS